MPAEKGNATVMNTNYYISKMLELLQDRCTYTVLYRDPAVKVERDLQNLPTDVFRFVPPEHKSLYYSLLGHNDYALALYGLPKIH